MLEVRNLACRRGGRVIFRGASWKAEAGETWLVTGANGSGKSSLLRLVSGLADAFDGRILWDGKDVAEDPDAHRVRAHYVGHLDAIKPEATARETMDYWAALRGCAANGETTAAALAAFGLTRLADRLGRGLSAGQRRRLSLARLLLADAPLWILDEPTTALDRDGQALLAAQITRHAAAGGIAVIATHDEMALPRMRRVDMDAVSRCGGPQ